MKIVSDTPKGKVEKRVPMYKDHAFMARLRMEFIADHNEKIRRKNKKPNARTSGLN